MMQLIALRRFTYGTRELRAGDVFDASSPGDARLLRALGRAKSAPATAPAHEPPAAAAQAVEAPAAAAPAEAGMPAAQNVAPAPAAAQRGRGRYARRDLRAEA